MSFDIFELDEKGIIPRIRESEEDFLKRGNLIIERSEEFTDEHLIGCSNSMFPDFKFFSFKDRFFFRKISIYYIRKMYGMDLSWVRTLKMKPISFYSYLILGICHPLNLNVEGYCFHCPIIFISLPNYNTIRHELLHAARLVEISKSVIYSSHFEEEIAANSYLEYYFFKTDTSKKFLKIREKLQRCFGENHGYVFIRLSCEEINDYVLKSSNRFGGNLERYLKEMSKTELRYRIMCQKLGL
ncbi:MAG: hypothetical protein HQ536_04220 [Parcubacteria group bacterium]|nr:hypothetical protein [Parcubacteria group bacterium]